MIKLYYTVSNTEGSQQDNPQLSLGGYKSSTPLANGDLNNLFGDISLLTIKQFNRNQYLGLIIVCETNDVDNVKIWTEIPETSYSGLKLSVVSMATGTDGFKQMERVQTINNKPIISEFDEFTLVEPFDVGNMKVGDMYGLWIERTIDVEKATETIEDVYQQDPTNINRYIEKEPETEDELIIAISFDVATNSVEGVNIYPEESNLNVGSTKQMTLVITPEDATDQTVVWASSDTDIAIVSQSGLVRGISEGEVWITATSNDGGFIGSSVFTVNNVNVTSISILPATKTLVVGGTQQLTFTILPINATDKDIVWTSNHEEIATVVDGLVTAIGAGVAIITATTISGSKTDTSTITVTT